MEPLSCWKMLKDDARLGLSRDWLTFGLCKSVQIPVADEIRKFLDCYRMLHRSQLLHCGAFTGQVDWVNPRSQLGHLGAIDDVGQLPWVERLQSPALHWFEVSRKQILGSYNSNQLIFSMCFHVSLSIYSYIVRVVALHLVPENICKPSCSGSRILAPTSR